MTILKISFSSSPVISVFLPVNLSNLSTCFESCLGFPQPCSTNTKSSDAGEIYIRQAYIKGVYIEDVSACASNVCTESTHTESTYIKCAYIRGICFSDICTETSICSSIACIGVGTSIGDAFTKNTCAMVTCTYNTYTEDTCAGVPYTSVSTIEHVEIYWQLS